MSECPHRSKVTVRVRIWPGVGDTQRTRETDESIMAVQSRFVYVRSESGSSTRRRRKPLSVNPGAHAGAARNTSHRARIPAAASCHRIIKRNPFINRERSARRRRRRPPCGLCSSGGRRPPDDLGAVDDGDRRHRYPMGHARTFPRRPPCDSGVELELGFLRRLRVSGRRARGW